MSKVIVVCGQAGVGKTTLSAELSKKLNIVCFHKDTIKERLFELLEGENLEDSKKVGMCSMELLFHLAEESMKNGVDIIVEAPFNHSSNPGIFEHWKNELGADMRVIVCELNDDKEHVRRFRERERHHSHKDFDRGWQPSPFDYSVMPGLKIKLDMSKLLDALVDESMEFIQK